jgi:hypothetical protein
MTDYWTDYGAMAGNREIIPPEQPAIAKDLALATDAGVRAAANSATMNLADVAGAGIDTLARREPDMNAALDARLAMTQQRREDYPAASFTGDVAGAALAPGMGGRTLAARMGGGLVPRAIGHGAEGALYGGVSAAALTKPGSSIDDYLGNTGTGAMLGSLFGLGTGAALGRAGPMQPVGKRPTAAELSGYTGQPKVQAVEDLIANSQAQGGWTGFDAALRPNALAMTRRERGQSPASRAGMDPAEIAAVENVANPGLGRSLLRVGGAGGHGGPVLALGALGLGGTAAYNAYHQQDPVTGAITGLAPAGVAMALRMAANRGAKKDATALRDMVAANTPMFRQRSSGAMMAPPGRGGDSVRNLLLQETLQQQIPPELPLPGPLPRERRY